MKTIKSGLLLTVSTAAFLGLSSCNSDPEPVQTLNFVDFSELSMQINDGNYWKYCYDENYGAVNVDNFAFSHSASSFTYGDATYSSWAGFCPSRVNDTQDYKDNWDQHQWAAIAPNPQNGYFLVGYSGSEVKSDPAANTTCSVSMSNGGYFNPVLVYVCNSSYTYYVAKNGNEFCPAFTANDTLTLKVVGVRDGVVTGQLELPLAKNNQYLTEWAPASLESLGTVSKVLFYIDSSSKGAYGLNVPAYFCITNFAYALPESVGI